MLGAWEKYWDGEALTLETRVKGFGAMPAYAGRNEPLSLLGEVVSGRVDVCGREWLGRLSCSFAHENRVDSFECV